MKPRFTPRALADLDSIYIYLHERNPKIAGEVISFVERPTDGLCNFPELGQRSDELNVRVILAGHYPYRIYYRIEADKIIIAHIRHMARKPPETGDV
jgi:plasmid stabilization system protein ParE